MLLSTYRYKPAAGWDSALESSLDSENTLVVAVTKFSHTLVRLASHQITDAKSSFEIGSHLASTLAITGLLFPLAIRKNLEEDGLTVRTILAVNEADNSITFAGDIPQGAFVNLMWANSNALSMAPPMRRATSRSILIRGVRC